MLKIGRLRIIWWPGWALLHIGYWPSIDKPHFWHLVTPLIEVRYFQKQKGDPTIIIGYVVERRKRPDMVIGEGDHD